MVQKSIEAGLTGGYGEYGVGNYYYIINDYDKAVEWYTKAAEACNIDAYASLGYIYTIQRNRIKAFDWYLKAAENGDTKGSKYIVGNFYEEENNYSMAKYWWTEAEKDGDIDAKNKLKQFEQNLYCEIM